MTKKHFVALAAKLLEIKPQVPNKTHVGVLPTPQQSRLEHWEFVVEELASFCQSQNPQFNRVKFIAACGLGFKQVTKSEGK